MKVKLNGYETLKRQIVLEGDEIVSKGEDLFLDESQEKSVPVSVAEALGIKYAQGREAFRFIKWFGNDWSKRLVVGFPIRGMMNENLGYDEEVGLGCRYIQGSLLEDVFNNIMLTAWLGELKYKGFITIKFNSTYQVIDLVFGAGLGLYNILEGVKTKITDFFMTGEGVMESWSMSIVLSRYPYPFKDKGERLWLNIPRGAEKHVWFYKISDFKNSCFTDSSKVCVVSAWATSLNEAVRRVLRTCRGLEIPMKQYRTDVSSLVASAWASYNAMK